VTEFLRSGTLAFPLPAVLLPDSEFFGVLAPLFVRTSLQGGFHLGA
jgi:hypothetical protein